MSQRKSAFRHALDKHDRAGILEHASRDNVNAGRKGAMPALLSLLTGEPSTMADDPALTRHLIELGAEVDAVSHHDGARTALYEACLGGKAKVAQALLDAGADPTWRKGKHAVLHAAAQGGLSEVVELALKHHKVDLLCGGTTALEDACYGRSSEVVKLLLARGANAKHRVKSGDWAGYSPIRFALEQGAVGCFEQLIEQGATVTLDDARALLDATLFGEVFEDVAEMLAYGGERVSAWVPQGPHRALAQQLRVRLGDEAAKAAELAREALEARWSEHLYRAVSQGDAERVRLWLEGRDVRDRSVNEDGHLLSEAAAHGQLTIAERLLDLGADVDSFDHDFGTPLFVAVSRDDRAMVSLLLARGANPSIASAPEGQHDPQCPLRIAAELNHIETAKLLLDAGAEVNGMFFDEQRIAESYGGDEPDDEHSQEQMLAWMLSAWGPSVLPLYQARSAEMVDLLLARGAPLGRRTIEVPDEGPQQLDAPLDIAIGSGRWAVAERLAHHGDQASATALSEALDRAHTTADAAGIEALLRLGAKLDKPPTAPLSDELQRRFEEAGAAPPRTTASNLAEAIEQRDLEAARGFVAEGAALDQQLDGDPPALPLDAAIARRDDDMAAWLVEAGAPYAESRFFHAPHRAAALGLSKTVFALLDRGLAIDARDDSGETLLHHAGHFGRLQLVEALLARGAGPDKRDQHGHSAIRNAFWGHHSSCSELTACTAVLRVMLEAGSQAKGLSGEICDRGADPSLLDLLAEYHRLDVHEESFSGLPLFDAVRSGQLDLVEALLRHGAEVNRRRPGNLFDAPETPLFTAAYEGNLSMIDLLLKHGARPEPAAKLLARARSFKVRQHLRKHGIRD